MHQMARRCGRSGPSGPLALAFCQPACDHFLSGPAGKPAEAIHEGWTIVAALAASTSTIELGQLVMCVSFRSPALLAKMAVTADGVSGGRLILGLGAGWYDRSTWHPASRPTTAPHGSKRRCRLSDRCCAASG
jgi:alkanesulfonate monooxygenase SsuD/methylene tetrahydromethanopterin reductase-like flavin-dependent oxidoreductase (luciferase family)